MTESCTMNYCQDGLQVYFATETQQYTYTPIYGHYELQPNDVNGRPYFKMSTFGFWYDGLGNWWISANVVVGQSFGFAYYIGRFIKVVYRIIGCTCGKSNFIRL